MKNGTCARCGTVGRMTTDHIIPRWLYKRIPRLKLGLRHNLGKRNEQLLCGQCNLEKGGVPDFAHPIAHELGDKLIELIINQRLRALKNMSLHENDIAWENAREQINDQDLEIIQAWFLNGLISYPEFLRLTGLPF